MLTVWGRTPPSTGPGPCGAHRWHPVSLCHLGVTPVPGGGTLRPGLNSCPFPSPPLQGAPNWGAWTLSKGSSLKGISLF